MDDSVLVWPILKRKNQIRITVYAMLIRNFSYFDVDNDTKNLLAGRFKLIILSARIFVIILRINVWQCIITQAETPMPDITVINKRH
ncbi:hypothetical protein CDW43_02140 [Methylophaga nitratireducenticrescens]|nr:hypothetical protein CDW43_02140 [Methylophaga nitratireducenticrescens]